MGFVQLGAQALARQFDHQAESIRWPRPAEPREPNFGRGTFQGQSLAKRPKIGLRPACAYQLALCDASKDRTDQEMEDIYSALRRRPDGRSLGAIHDFMWQVAALLLGSHTVSAAEYHALLGALVRSTRKWALRPVSRNYVAYLRRTFQDPIR